MILSEDRQSHFARLIVDAIWDDDLVEYTNEDSALRMAKKGVSAFVQEYEDIDKKVRNTVTSLKRDVPEGSNEWDVLFNKYFEEELKRRGV